MYKLLATVLLLGNVSILWATAAGQAPFTFIRSVRENIGFVMGYGNGTASSDFYAQTNCPTQDPAPTTAADCDDAPPRGGLVATAATMMSELQTMLSNAGIGSCDAIPASGTSSLTTSEGVAVTATYLTPSHTVPSGWTNGGEAYTKAVKLTMSISSITTLMLAEFACGKPSIYLKLNMQVGAHAPGYYRYINIVSGKKSGDIRTSEIFISEYNPTSDRVRGAYALTVDINEANTTYKIKGVVTANTGNVNALEKVNVHGNYTTQLASVYLKRFALSSGSYYDASTVSALSGASSAAVGSSSSYDFTDDWCNVQSYSGGYPTCDSALAAQTAGTILDKQGCIDLNSPTTALTSNSLCSGQTLEDPGTPVIDASGAFSLNWLIGTMHTKIDVSGIENP